MSSMVIRAPLREKSSIRRGSSTRTGRPASPRMTALPTIARPLIALTTPLTLREPSGSRVALPSPDPSRIRRSKSRLVSISRLTVPSAERSSRLVVGASHSRHCAAAGITGTVDIPAASARTGKKSKALPIGGDPRGDWLKQG